MRLAVASRCRQRRRWPRALPRQRRVAAIDHARRVAVARVPLGRRLRRDRLLERRAAADQVRQLRAHAFQHRDVGDEIVVLRDGAVPGNHGRAGLQLLQHGFAERDRAVEVAAVVGVDERIPGVVEHVAEVHGVVIAEDHGGIARRVRGPEVHAGRSPRR